VERVLKVAYKQSQSAWRNCVTYTTRNLEEH